MYKADYELSQKAKHAPGRTNDYFSNFFPSKNFLLLIRPYWFPTHQPSVIHHKTIPSRRHSNRID
jgi:hypothetical protein